MQIFMRFVMKCKLCNRMFNMAFDLFSSDVEWGLHDGDGNKYFFLGVDGWCSCL